MAKKRKVRADRLIIAILVSFIAISLIAIGGYKIYDLLFNDNNNDNHEDPKPIETTENVHVSISDYEVYVDDSKELGFDFIIATLDFVGDNPVSFDLSNLVTSEKVYLNQVSNFMNTLIQAGYKIDKFNIVDKIVTDQKSVSANILIPIKDNKSIDSLAVYYNQKKIEFNLNNNPIAATTLKLKEENQTIVVDDASVYVSKAYISSTMMHFDERYPLPGGIKPYTFEIIVKQAKNSIKIVDAIFIDDEGYENHCLNSEYHAVDCENIVNKELNIGDSGALFFEVLTDSKNIQDGTLLIKFSNSNDWIEVSTNIE